MDRTGIMGREMWDARFEGEDYLFGTEPAIFVTERAGILADGSEILCVADGEGRNSVWLAEQGHAVTAFDISPVGVEKARALATRRGAKVDFHIAGIDDWDWSRSYDSVAGIFIQFLSPEARPQAFSRIRDAIRPGGVLLLHGYAPRQVEYGTGGPPFAENMYTLDLLHDAFAGWEVLHADDYDRHIDEGPGHSGLSALVDFVARKPD
ncbi:MAG: class I SAM-dependent methyltransferase [Pseudomonadota bacterium]